MRHPLEPLPSQRPSTLPDDLAAALVAGASDAIMVLDLEGSVQLWNDACESLFGWPADQMLGRPANMLLPQDRQDEFARVLRALEGAPESAALETERLHRSGHVVPVSCRISPLFGTSGRVIGASAIVRDNSRELELRRQLDQARHLAEARFTQSVVAQATLTAEGRILEVNPALCRLSGYAPRDLMGRPVTDFMGDDDHFAVVAGLARVTRGDQHDVQHPRLLRRADGTLIETRASVFPIRDDVSGRVVRLELVVEDLSPAYAAQRELQVREARWQSMALHSADVALFLTADARLLFVNSAISAVFGYRPEDVLELDGWSFVHPDDEPGMRAVWDAVVAAPIGTTRTVEGRLLHADGSWRWVEESLTNSLDDPAVCAMVVNLRDISARKAAEAVLDELAGIDTLTGIATRAPLMAALDAAFAGDLASSTAVAVVDVARMKLINNTYGHRVGDEVLCEVATRLRAAACAHGVVARLGADQFAVLLHRMTDSAAVFEACAALLSAVEAPLEADGRSLMVSVSIGAALGPAVESGALLAAAESALTTAKQAVVGPMHVVRAESASAAVCRARVVEDLRRGLQQDELVVHFQPVVTIPDGRPVAAEALVRWAHPDKGLLGPAAFIDAAEESGLIVEVGQKVLREACLAAARWAELAAPGPFHVAVNLSAKQLTRGGVVDVVHGALAASGASARNLVLEVTESAVMSDVDEAVRILQELRDLGVAIAVDDFGTGYSSLTYLKRFPVTTLKIDRSFVSGLGTNADDAAIVTSVIDLARAMGLDCIAEGVETEQQRLVLQALGCEYGQGFLWSRPLERSVFEAWFAAASLRRPTAPSAVVSSDRSLLRDVDALAAKGASLATIAAALNADQRQTGEGKRWTARTVAHLMATRTRG